MASMIFLKDDRNIATRFEYSMCNTLPFAWVPKVKNGKVTKEKDFMWVGKKGKNHRSCEFLNDTILVEDLITRGRLWISTNYGKIFNIISYWSINKLTPEDVKKDVEELSKLTGIDFTNWNIDLGTTIHAKDGEVIPLKEFIGVDFDDEQLEIRELIKKYHTATYLEKEKIKDILKKRYNYDIFPKTGKKRLTAKQRFYKYMYQEKFVINFKNFLK